MLGEQDSTTICLFVEGLTSKSFEKLKSNITKDFSSVIIKHKNNYSQSTAILTGIFNSKYENIITLDAKKIYKTDNISKIKVEDVLKHIN